jgi:phosphoenolpyruvate carboxykinase (ATP)
MMPGRSLARRALQKLTQPSYHLAATYQGVRHAASISKKEALMATLKDQLKQSVLKEVSREQIEGLSLDMWSPGTRDQELELLGQVNALDLDVDEIFYQTAPSILYQEATQNEKGSRIVSSGALAVLSGKKTGRSPLDKRVVDEPGHTEHVWWGPVNVKLSDHSFMTNRERAVDYLNTQEKLYVVDGFGGWDHECRLPVRVITSRPYHALFMQNMLVMPTAEELVTEFGPNAPTKPFVIYNAGCFPCNRQTEGMTSSTSVAVSFERKEMVILGTQYAGEMKKVCLH